MSYLMAGQLSELERLQLQSRVWEPAGERLLNQLGDGAGQRVLDVGCGAMGWLRILSQWVGPTGRVIGTDFAESMISTATEFIEREPLTNVEIVQDDLFNSRLEPRSFDLVHARFQLAPLGRFDEQLDAYVRLVASGGLLVLEDPDTSSWHYSPGAESANELVALIREAFVAAGGDFDAGRVEYELLNARGFSPQVRAEIVALQPGHPYLQLPLQFAASLRPRLVALRGEPDLDALLERTRSELQDESRRGLTFTLVQTWARIPAA